MSAVKINQDTDTVTDNKYVSYAIFYNMFKIIVNIINLDIINSIFIAGSEIYLKKI